MISDRLYESRWGVFNHYLYGTMMDDTVPSWNDCVNMFDCSLAAKQLHDVGASYLFITVMQGDEHMIAPNSAFDRIAGTAPGTACAERDLVDDLYKELEKYGIDLYLYYTGDGPYKKTEIGKRFGFIEPRKNVSMDFVVKWAEVLREYSVRYGDKVKGWWVDGCYRDAFGYNDELLEPYYKAIKAGNPNAVCAFNNGVKKDLEKNYKDEDFVCGEFNDFTYIPKSRFISGAQAHILAPLGVSATGNPYEGWCRPGTKHDGAYMREYVKAVNAAGGVVTIDIPVKRDGSYYAEQLEVLSEINA